MDKKRLWPALIGVLAIAVVGGALFLVLSFSTPPSCRLVAGTPVASPDGAYFGVHDQTVCEDASRSRSTVSIGTPGGPERLTVMDFAPRTSVTLAWQGNDNLGITYPSSVTAKTYGPYEGWPGITAMPNSDE